VWPLSFCSKRSLPGFDRTFEKLPVIFDLLPRNSRGLARLQFLFESGEQQALNQFRWRAQAQSISAAETKLHSASLHLRLEKGLPSCVQLWLCAASPVRHGFGVCAGAFQSGDGV